MTRPSFVLITPARNEARFIAATIDSVAAQSLPPRRWVIVSDGSTDDTYDLAQGRARSLPMLSVVRREAGAARDFSSKVAAIRRGLEEIGDVPYEFIGILDADIVLPPDYFERLFAAFESQPRLGIAGGEIREERSGARAQLVDTAHSVAGAVQMFRRECWEQVGGLIPLPRGGEDSAAEIMARMHGWETRTIRGLTVVHQRATGSEGRGALRAFYDMGRREAALGYHPIFELFRAANRMLATPYVLGGLIQLGGYAASKLRGEKPGPPPECVAYLRREQRLRIQRLFGVRRSR